MIFLKILLLVAIIAILIKDLSLTKGRFIKAKIIHVLSIAFLIYYYASGFTWIAWLIQNFSNFRMAYNKDYGIIPSDLIMVDYAIYNALAAIVTICVLGLLVRSNYYRKLMLQIFPFIILTGTIVFYTGFQPKVHEFINDYISLIISLFGNLILNVWIYLAYRSKFMIEFFDDRKINYAQQRV
jgi:hypothetical protein